MDFGRIAGLSMSIAANLRKNPQRLIRPLAGVIAANLLLALVYAKTSLAGRSAFYSVGWGLMLLGGVRAREIYSRYFKSSWKLDPSWSAALASYLLWSLVATPFLFRFEWRSVLDLSIYPLCVVYIGAKTGCIYIGCCDWGARFKHIANSWWRLPALELVYNLVVISSLTVFLARAPAGAKFLTYLLLHVIGWRFFKFLR